MYIVPNIKTQYKEEKERRKRKEKKLTKKMPPRKTPKKTTTKKTPTKKITKKQAQDALIQVAAEAKREGLRLSDTVPLAVIAFALYKYVGPGISEDLNLHKVNADSWVKIKDFAADLIGKAAGAIAGGGFEKTKRRLKIAAKVAASVTGAIVLALPPAAEYYFKNHYLPPPSHSTLSRSARSERSLNNIYEVPHSGGGFFTRQQPPGGFILGLNQRFTNQMRGVGKQLQSFPGFKAYHNGGIQGFKAYQKGAGIAGIAGKAKKAKKTGWKRVAKVAKGVKKVAKAIAGTAVIVALGMASAYMITGPGQELLMKYLNKLPTGVKDSLVTKRGFRPPQAGRGVVGGGGGAGGGVGGKHLMDARLRKAMAAVALLKATHKLAPLLKTIRDRAISGAPLSSPNKRITAAIRKHLPSMDGDTHDKMTTHVMQSIKKHFSTKDAQQTGAGILKHITPRKKTLTRIAKGVALAALVAALAYGGTKVTKQHLEGVVAAAKKIPRYASTIAAALAAGRGGGGNDDISAEPVMVDYLDNFDTQEELDEIDDDEVPDIENYRYELDMRRPDFDMTHFDYNDD